MMRINGCSFVSYRGGTELNTRIVRQAETELRQIEAEGKIAGTDFAWWRTGFDDAIKDLKKLVKRAEQAVTEPKNYESSFAKFLGTDEDGLI